MKFSRRHVMNTMAKALSQGTTPRKLAITCALGIVIGIFPVWGITTWICLGLAIIFRLNVVVIQLINYLFFPIQLALILPFINTGIWLFDLPPFPYDSDQLLEMFRTDFTLILKETGLALGAGITVWAVVAVPLFFLLFYFSFLAFTKWKLPASAS
jgi:uncharacterized protein (DUF2062 family)